MINDASSKRKSLLETFSSRTKLQFKSSQVLLPDHQSETTTQTSIKKTKDDEAYESEDEMSSEQQHSHSRWAALDKPSSLTTSEQEEDDDHRTLYERLMENKLKKQKEIEEKNAPQGPKSLDEDDVHYLREQEELMKEKEREIKKQEEEEIAKYLKGEMDRVGSVNLSTVLPDDKDDDNINLQEKSVGLSNTNSVLPISDFQVVEVKKRKRNDAIIHTSMTVPHDSNHAKKKKKNNKKNNTSIVNANLLEYDSS
ncbi:hypothetical protein C9374_002285 [Naegleria lovaniensis]|uniref:FAM192A/Fyv6 N-terminal domain-containing protein n=1 Tax=Naegleria lovaniensis TaxID=51637 RepID=A0AA88GVD3_NAELO|nr:uncharacterized protein C9374_002285 [Naegleria lovaniensis]KAG2386541.1 hypothetical protein C9374_002285 [Naegleria lovaniensis]